MKRGRNTTLVRCLMIWRRVEGRRVCPSLRVLAAEHGVCERTIRRDLEALQEARLPVPPSLRELNREAEV